jgi:hypothetical protein
MVAGKIKKSNVRTLKDVITCICILHNMLVDNNVAMLPELERERSPDFDTVDSSEFSNQFVLSRVIRKNIAKYLSKLERYPLNEYPTTI